MRIEKGQREWKVRMEDLVKAGKGGAFCLATSFLFFSFFFFFKYSRQSGRQLYVCINDCK